MSLIGIITNQKNESYIIKELSKYISIDNIIFITEKNIQNIKNVKFQTILIDREIKSSNSLKNIISNSKYIILNSDLTNIDLSVLNNIKLNIITYGFNNKATFTVSSISEDKIIICLQRIIKNVFEEKFEPQEYTIYTEQNTDTSAVIGAICITLIYNKR